MKMLVGLIRAVLILMLLSTRLMCILWLPHAVPYAIGYWDVAKENTAIQYFLYTACALVLLSVFCKAREGCEISYREGRASISSEKRHKERQEISDRQSIEKAPQRFLSAELFIFTEIRSQRST